MNYELHGFISCTFVFCYKYITIITKIFKLGKHHKRTYIRILTTVKIKLKVRAMLCNLKARNTS